MFNKASIKHIINKINGDSRILMRADFNVPIVDGKITDLTRVKSTIPSIQDLLSKKPKSLVILSHMGRPDGKPNPKYSLKPVVPHLEQLLNRKVNFLNDCVGKEVQDAVDKAQNEVFLCENVRFHIEEEGSVKSKDGKKTKADPAAVTKFRKDLSALGNIFVNDAFGAAHRAHSSVVGIDHKYRVAGHLMKKELDFFKGIMENPKKPFLVIIGGSKVSDKIKLISNMIDKADEIIIGGGMGYTFLKKIYNIPIGKSLFDAEGYKHIDELLEKAKKKGVKMHFVTDVNCAKEFKNDTEARVFDVKTGIEEGWEGMDAGPESIKARKEVIGRAKTILWNGPTGVIEFPQFRKSSLALLHDIIEQTKKGATSVVGGGDSVSLVTAEKAEDKLSHVSTGGGASLELMEGTQLPGVKHLSEESEVK